MALTLKTAKPGAGMQLGAVAWDKLMNSGAGMVSMYLSRPQPRFGATAKRFFLICSFIEVQLEEPRKSSQADYELFVNCCRRRELAAELIGYGCEPLISAGLLTPNFCQAGVVAPPDSPGFGKTADDEDAFHEERFFESQLMSGDR